MKLLFRRMRETKITNEELMRILEERLQSTSDLQVRIDELTDKLYLVNKRLKEAESYKGHFISNITNEIINPFSSILILSENIQKLDDKEIDKAKRMAELINNEAFHLDFQLKNIFAASMVESGKEVISISKVNLKSFMQSIISFFQKQVDTKHLQLSCKFNAHKGGDFVENFATDIGKLEFIIKNLLSNAVKFSHVGGKIELLLKTGDQGIQFTIRDFGKGIPLEEREQIFDRFKQVDERINSINTGHGLGLSIVKSFCDMLNGKVEMNFPDDGGTIVNIELPEAESQEEIDDLADFIIDPGEKF